MKMTTLFSRAIVLRVILALALAAGITSLPGATAQAIYCGTTVTNTSDSASTSGSLRWMIACITSGGTITFDSALSGQTITLTTGQITIGKNITIDGSSLATPITISGNHANRIFNITSGSTVTLDTLIITDGQQGTLAKLTSPEQGGAIKNAGDLTLQNMTFTNNKTISNQSEGGAIYNDGTLHVQFSTFSGNAATSYWSYGGAIFNASTRTMVIIDSTFSGNSAHGASEGRGGAIYNVGTMSVSFGTFSGNSAQVDSGTAYGGGINNAGTGTLINTIVAGSGSAGGNCSGTFSGSSKDNLADDGTCGSSFTNSPSINLGTLGNYGGPTQTIPILTGSLAIDGAPSRWGYVSGRISVE